MVISQCDVWWAEFAPNGDATAAFPRPVIVLQETALNRTGIATILCVPLTTNVSRARAVGNVLLDAGETGLPKDSVAMLPLVQSVDRRALRERVGSVGGDVLYMLFRALDTVLRR